MLMGGTWAGWGVSTAYGSARERDGGVSTACGSARERHGRIRPADGSASSGCGRVRPQDRCGLRKILLGWEMPEHGHQEEVNPQACVVKDGREVATAHCREGCSVE